MGSFFVLGYLESKGVLHASSTTFFHLTWIIDDGIGTMKKWLKAMVHEGMIIGLIAQTVIRMVFRVPFP